MKYSPGISNFLDEISSLFHSIVFLYFLSLFTEEGFLISPCYSLELWFKWVYLFFSPLLFTSLLFSAICKASSDNHFAFFHFCFSGVVFTPPPVQCYEPLSRLLQVPCLSDLIPWIYLSLPLYNQGVWFRSYLNGLVIFPTFFNLSPKFAIMSSWSEQQSAPGLQTKGQYNYLKIN